MSGTSQWGRWSALLVVGLGACEVLIMISPFAGFFYAGVRFEPFLGLLSSTPATAWLDGFFLNHSVVTTSWLLAQPSAAVRMLAHFTGCETLLAHLAERSPSSSGKVKPWTPGLIPLFEATYPRPTRSRTYASPAASPRPSQGSLPARAGSPLAGRVSHPLDDKRSFMVASQPPLPFDQPRLVALLSLVGYTGSALRSSVTPPAAPRPDPAAPRAEPAGRR